MRSSTSCKRAVFLDRDDTLIRDVRYLSDPALIEPLEGAFDAVKIINNLGLPAIVVTNQSGIARGLFDEERLASIHERLLDLFRENGARIDAIYYCPHHPDGVVERYRMECGCRKPAPGMLIRAGADFGLDLERCFLIGDKAHDIEAIHRVGGTGILLGKDPGGEAPEYTAQSLMDAVRWIGENLS